MGSNININYLIYVARRNSTSFPFILHSLFFLKLPVLAPFYLAKLFSFLFLVTEKWDL